ncbi:MAG: MerR family transcriptional regulator [Marinilabiliaceae bacterium]|nr:MerR family transcriptional regulator [Marinilabiliaceae bacterium]
MAEKLYYSIGEAAEELGVPTSTVRYWEQQFSILKPRRNKKGDRFFSQKDMANLRTIYILVKQQGLTIAGTRKKLKENPEGTSHNAEIVSRLNAIKSELSEYIDILNS